VPKSKEYLGARDALLERAGLIEPKGDASKTSTPSGGAQRTEQVSERVQQVLDVYVSGLEAWKRATDYAKSAVEGMAPKLNISVDVKYQDDFQYFYAYSDYAQEMTSMALSKGINIDDELETLDLSDEAYNLADDYLKMGDKAAIELIAECAGIVEPLIDKIEDGNYTISDVDILRKNMLDIIDVLDISYSVAGSFDWVVNSADGYDLSDNQVSFDSLMVKYVNMANSLLADPSTQRDVNAAVVDIVVRVRSLLPLDRHQGDAPYVKSMISYLEEPIVNDILSELYK
jgi:hypothetical protein